MTEHTPEPWRLSDEKNYQRSILCLGWRAYPDKKVICTVRPYPRTNEAWREGAENARRIVACVNACAGIPTDALEDATLNPALDDYERLMMLSRHARSAATET